MLKVDEFESVFRSASKEPFHHRPPEIRKVLVVTDLGGDQTSQSAFPTGSEGRGRFIQATRELLGILGDAEWMDITGDDFRDVAGLLEAVKTAGPDLICSYRNLRGDSWRWGHSLGASLKVMSSETAQPVLALPNPHELPDLAWSRSGTDSIMVMTDHISGDDALVNWGLRLAEPGANLWLTHVEDDAVFERYMDVISKIASIDTEIARKDILRQLLKEPSDYIESTKAVVEPLGLGVEVQEIVKLGHRVDDYRALVEEHAVDLLVVRASDQGQIGIHGASYSLAAELRGLPILLV